jgi:hypothetical protein
VSKSPLQEPFLKELMEGTRATIDRCVKKVETEKGLLVGPN